MRKIFVLKSVAYGAKATSGTVTTKAELTQLAQGAIVLLEGENVLTSADSIMDLPPETLVKIVTGVGTSAEDVDRINVKVSVPFPIKNILNKTSTDYLAPVPQVLTLSNFTDIVGEGEIKVYSKTANHSINYESVRINLVRKEGETKSAFIDRVVAKLNNPYNPMGNGGQANNAFFTASKTGSAPDFNVVLTAANADIDLGVAIGSIFETVTVTETTERVISIGAGRYVLGQELEARGEDGYQGYERWTDAWWKQPTEALASVNYDAIDIAVQLQHSTPQNKVNSAVEEMTIFIPTGAAVRATLETILGITEPEEEEGGSN